MISKLEVCDKLALMSLCLSHVLTLCPYGSPAFTCCFPAPKCFCVHFAMHTSLSCLAKDIHCQFIMFIFKLLTVLLHCINSK